MENNFKFLFLATLFCGLWMNCASWQPREQSVEAQSEEVGGDAHLIVEQNRIVEKFVLALEEAERRRTDAMMHIEHLRNGAQRNDEEYAAPGSLLSMSRNLRRKQFSDNEYYNSAEDFESKLERLREEAIRRYREDVRRAKMELERDENQLEGLGTNTDTSDNSVQNDDDDSDEGKVVIKIENN